MPDSQSEIGILACPGGMKFAQMVHAHLETITADKMEERARALSRVYGVPRTEVIRQINLARDVLASW